MEVLRAAPYSLEIEQLVVVSIEAVNAIGFSLASDPSTGFA